MLYFIVNDNSRSGRSHKIWTDISRELKNQEIVFKAYRPKNAAHAAKIAGEISMMDDDDLRLVVIGGDGTINEVINGIKDFSKVKFACISSGSGNDFARGLKICGNHIEQLKNIISSGVTQRIDIGKVTFNGENTKRTRYFGISSGIGLDAIVCKKALDSKQKNFLNKIGLGKLTYVLLTVESLFSMQTIKATVEFDEDNKPFYADKMIFLAAMNMSAEGGGVRMTPDASCSDGKLSVCLAHKIPKWRTFFCLPLLMAAKHTGLKGFEIKDGRKITVTTDRPVVLHTDGEYCDDVTKIEFECCHEMLNIIR